MVAEKINKFIYRLRLRSYVIKNLKKGHSLEQSKKKLLKHGVEKKLVETVIVDVENKRVEKFRNIALLTMVFVIFIYVFYFSNLDFFYTTYPKHVPNFIYDFCNRQWWGNEKFLIKKNDADFRFSCFKIFGIKPVQRKNNYIFLTQKHSCYVDLVDNNVSQTYECYYEKYSNNSEYNKCGLMITEHYAPSSNFRGNFILTDVIIAVNGEEINSTSELNELLLEYEEGDFVVFQTTFSLIKTRIIELANQRKSIGVKVNDTYCPNTT